MMTGTADGDHFEGTPHPPRAEDFDALYSGTPPWDIGRPQPAFLELAKSGAPSPGG